MPNPDQPNYLESAKMNLKGSVTAIDVAGAQALATIALVEAQETANLIAFYTMSDEDAAGLLKQGVMTHDKFEALAKNIAERLGLS